MFKWLGKLFWRKTSTIEYVVNDKVVYKEVNGKPVIGTAEDKAKAEATFKKTMTEMEKMHKRMEF